LKRCPGSQYLKRQSGKPGELNGACGNKIAGAGLDVLENENFDSFTAAENSWMWCWKT
jgi:hypothetical protein